MLAVLHESTRETYACEENHLRSQTVNGQRPHVALPIVDSV